MKHALPPTSKPAVEDAKCAYPALILAGSKRRADVIRTRQDIAKFKRAEVQQEMEKLLRIYCKRRSAFMEAGRAAELPVEFSDYATRERPVGSRRNNKGKRTTPKEYTSHSDAESQLEHL